MLHVIETGKNSSRQAGEAKLSGMHKKIHKIC